MPPIWSKVLLLGDSLTQHSHDVENGCWASLLANRLRRISDVVPRGFSGYNTRWIRMILPQQIFTQDDVEKACCVVILLGTNDSIEPEAKTQQYVPLAEYRDNLAAIVNYFKENGLSKEKIILITPPTYDPDVYLKLSKGPGKQSYPRFLEEYVRVVTELAKEMGVDCLDLYTITSNHEKMPHLFHDGLHFSRLGAQVVYESLWPLIEKKVIAFHGSLELKFPDWEAIDRQDPAKSLCKS